MISIDTTQNNEINDVGDFYCTPAFHMYMCYLVEFCLDAQLGVILQWLEQNTGSFLNFNPLYNEGKSFLYHCLCSPNYEMSIW